MRVIGYARISTNEQAQTNALAQQIARLKQAGATEIFQDVESGKKSDRKNFLKLMKLVEVAEVDCVIFTRLDRMSRTLTTALEAVSKFEKSGVALRILDDNIDTRTAVGKLNTHIMATLSQFEVDRLSERVKHGLQHLRDKRTAVKPPFAYIKVNGRYELNHQPWLCLLDSKKEMTVAEIAKDMIELFFEFRSLRATIKHINEKYGIVHIKQRREDGKLVQNRFGFTPAGLSTWLHNPVLQGHTSYLKKKNNKKQDPSLWDIELNTHPDHVLITLDQIAKIDEILAANKEKMTYRPSSKRHPIAGLVVCCECKTNCYFQTGTRRNRKEKSHYYQCKKSCLKACPNTKMTRVEKIESAIVKTLLDYRSGSVFETKDTDRQVNEKLVELQQQLAGLEVLGHNPAIQTAKAQIKNQIKLIKERAKVIDIDKLNEKDFLGKLDELGEIKDGSLFTTEHSTILRKLIKEVWIKDGEVNRVVLNV